jgi:hypothetical protein
MSRMGRRVEDRADGMSRMGRREVKNGPTGSQEWADGWANTSKHRMKGRGWADGKSRQGQRKVKTRPTG